ncbi:MAG: hypothetical protein KY462_03955 [Actinobacteria bacterium]|nr:hypothetical protein [Actinomycetota bacterium]
MDNPTLQTALGVTRVAIGTGLLLAPRLAARPWIGADAARPGTKAMTRAAGARDMAIGVGTLLARRHGASARGWLEAAALVDAADAAATLLAWRHLPRAGRWTTLVMAATATVLDLRAAGAVPTRRNDGRMTT